jgi:hypothetical protein
MLTAMLSVFRKMMRNKVIAVFVLAGAWILAIPGAHAQAAASKDSSTVTDQDIKLLRQDLRSNKKQLIAANLTLTEAEATKFWPVYDRGSEVRLDQGICAEFRDADGYAGREFAESLSDFGRGDRPTANQLRAHH